uniref:Uncharacterized protein n=1 Tax=Anguilla anguilla TaxID=7936 RepID=A0A0E9SIA7_ANGAN
MTGCNQYPKHGTTTCKTMKCKIPFWLFTNTANGLNSMCLVLTKRHQFKKRVLLVQHYQPG